MQALSLQKLYGSGHRHLRRDLYEQIHVVAIDGPSIDRHLPNPKDLPQELSGLRPDIPYQDWVPVLRHPDQVGICSPIQRSCCFSSLYIPQMLYAADFPVA